jgi:hypothetical protein
MEFRAKSFQCRHALPGEMFFGFPFVIGSHMVWTAYNTVLTSRALVGINRNNTIFSCNRSGPPAGGPNGYRSPPIPGTQGFHTIA